MTATTFKPGQSRASPSVLPPPRAPPKKISNTPHCSSRIWAGLPRGDQATLTLGSATKSIIAAYRARARLLPLPIQHCPSSQAESGSVWGTPDLFGFVERPSQRPVDLPRPFDGFHQLGT